MSHRSSRTYVRGSDSQRRPFTVFLAVTSCRARAKDLASGAHQTLGAARCATCLFQHRPETGTSGVAPRPNESRRFRAHVGDASHPVPPQTCKTHPVSLRARPGFFSMK